MDRVKAKTISLAKETTLYSKRQNSSVQTDHSMILKTEDPQPIVQPPIQNQENRHPRKRFKTEAFYLQFYKAFQDK